MRLYTFFRGSSPFRVRIALNLKRLDYEQAFVHLGKGEHRRPEFAAVNPQGLLPVLEDEGQRLQQSLAILEYLEEKFPEPPLLPKDRVERARVRSLALLVACEIHPLNNPRVLNYLTRTLGCSDEQKNAWYRHWIHDGLEKFEGCLTGTPGTARFCHGDAPTLADCCLVPQIFNARRFGCDTSHAPTAMRIFDACMALEAFDRAQPSKQPDAEP